MANLTGLQKLTLLIGLALVVAAGVFPPLGALPCRREEAKPSNPAPGLRYSLPLGPPQAVGYAAPWRSVAAFSLILIVLLWN